MNSIKKYERYVEIRDKLKILSRNESNSLVIHYSCESFYDIKDCKTPRITSICVRNFDTGQTHSFSIHKAAEIKKVNNSDISKQYDCLERSMLKEFFDFMKKNDKHTWVHWNMRDINYGFQAIEHRYKVLGGKPCSLDDNYKFDLSIALVSLYGNAYIGHPRLPKLMKKNHITEKDFLSGEEEAEAFEQNEFIKLHQSTLRKADILANILGRTLDGSLKNNSKWYERYGVSPKSFGFFIKEYWVFSLVSIVASVIAISQSISNY